MRQLFLFLEPIISMRQLSFLFLFFSFISCTSEEGGDTPSQQNLQLISVHVGGEELSIDGPNEGLPLDQSIVFRFAQAILTSSVESAITLTADDGSIVALEFSYLDDNKSVSISTDPLSEGVSYTVDVTSELMGANGEIINEIKITFSTLIVPLQVNEITVDGISVDKNERIKDVSRSPEIQMIFSEPVTVTDLANQIEVKLGSLKPTYELSQVSENTLKLKVTEELLGYREYALAISDELTNSENKPFEGYSLEFFTKLDSTLKFTEITDDLLLTKIQEETFKYFWDFAHPSSGLIRERNTSADLVTIGGSGFGLMTILVGIERGFITRAEGVERLETIVDFLQTKAERFHGVWPHWLSGSTGKTIPFSTNDDGGDLVETSFMVQGLLTVRQYLNALDATELSIQTKINQLCDEVEWDWYTQGGQDILYWHWSENFGWEKNHKITGWNEALITYVLAASSTTHPVSKEVYTSGWSRDGDMVNTSGSQFFEQQLQLRSDMGGPLFFSHYSFLGLDPRNLEDQYADYWQQNVSHSLINQAYCQVNPKNYIGYAAYSWGLTASDNDQGYSAHSPNNDLGVITPTAAISSLPYTPEESMKAIRHFYYILGDRLWGDYGFVDAFNITENWTASSYLAIDQGPIIIMIENHRTGLLWDLFMSAPEVQAGLTKLDFTSFNKP